MESFVSKKYFPYLILTFLSVVLFIPGLNKIPTIDRDEAHFAQASRQMVENDEYFQIRFQEVTRYQKPPGINWLQAGFVHLLSSPESGQIWPYRIPSALGAWLSVLLTYFFASQFILRKTALLGAGFLACALLLMIESHMAVIDTSLLSSVVLMQGALWVVYAGYKKGIKVNSAWAVLFWLAMAYGFVLKGVTPLVGGLTLATLCIVERNIRLLKRVHVVWGLLLFLTLSLLWLFQVNAAENSNYLLQMFKKDLLPKLQGGHESHGQPPLFHLAILPLTLWPASLFLWQGLVFSYRRKSDGSVGFLLAWIIPTWIFFELMPTKLPQYVLPTFPAIALLMASAVIGCTQYELKRGRVLKTLQILWGVLTLGLALSFTVISYLILKKVTFIAALISISIGLLGLLCTGFSVLGDYKKAIVSMFVMVLIGYPLVFFKFLPSLAPIWSTDLVKNAPVNTLENTKNPLIAVGYHEPSLVMAFGTNNVKYMGLEGAVALTSWDKNYIILIDGESFKSLPKSFNHKILWQEDAFNYSKGRWLKLYLLKPV